MVLTDDEFKLFSSLVYNESGIVLKDAKKEYLQARIQKRLEANQLTSYYRYYKFVTDKIRGKRELHNLVDSVTINETSFFRNRPQFDLFENLVLPSLINNKNRINNKIRLWSAGCSRGQEPYSIAMSMLNNAATGSEWDIKILASDISMRMLDFAQKGTYSEHEMENVTRDFRASYFEQKQGLYLIKKQVKDLVVFDYHNLKNDNGLKDLDVIFCRNVMIYFDQDDQKRLVNKLFQSLTEGGYLFLGHTESIQGMSNKFKFIYHSSGTVYQKTV